MIVYIEHPAYCNFEHSDCKEDTLSTNRYMYANQVSVEHKKLVTFLIELIGYKIKWICLIETQILIFR